MANSEFKRILCISITLTLIWNCFTLAQFTNYKINTVHNAQNDRFFNPTITINPLNTTNLVVGLYYHDIASTGHVYYYYYSVANGWGGDISVSSQYDVQAKPSISFDRGNNCFLAFHAYKNPSGDIQQNGIFVAKSTDQGANWPASVAVVDNGDPATNNYEDEPKLICDQTNSSGYGNSIYVVWTRQFQDGTTPSLIYFSKSTNAATSFSPSPTLLNTATSSWHQGPAIANGLNGLLYATWLKDNAQIEMAVSTNGGSNWVKDLPITTVSPVSLVMGNLTTNSNPSLAVDASAISTHKGKYYLAWADHSSGNSDIYFCSGEIFNNELAISAVSRINNNSDETDQWSPRVTVGPDGTVYIIYYDGRSNDGKFDTYVAISADGGSSFVNYKVSTSPQDGDHNTIGDYIDIASSSSTVYPIWTDARSRYLDVYLGSFTLAGTSLIQVFDNEAQLQMPVKMWNGSDFTGLWSGVLPYSTWMNNLPLFQKIVFTGGTDETFLASQLAITNPINGTIQKFHDWKDVNDVTNHKNFTLSPQKPTLTINFRTTKSGVTIQNELIDLPGVPDQAIDFKDPWYIDFSDNLFDGQMRNRGVLEAQWHNGLTSSSNCFNPNTNPGTQGYDYLGVFLAQDYTVPDKPYYEVRTPAIWNGSGSSLTMLGHTSYFLNWSSSGATFLHPDQLETPVMFTSSPTVVRANYKGHLCTSTPASFNNQRKVAQGDLAGQPLAMTYESAGDIWYCNSMDGGATWSREELVSQGDKKYSNASVDQIFYYSGMNSYSKTEVAWEENPVGGTGYRIWARKRDEFTGVWGSPYLVHEDLAAHPVAALPVISGTNVYWRGPNSILYKDILCENCNFQPQAVSGTDANSANQSTDDYSGYSYVVWEQTGVGIRYLCQSTGIVLNIASNSPYETNTHPVIVRNKSGDACIAWEYRNTGNLQGNIKFCKVSSSGTVSSTIFFVNCAGIENYPTSPTLSSNLQAGSGNDDVTLVWNTASSGIMCARYSSGSWTSPYQIAPSGQYGSVNKTRISGQTQRIITFKGLIGPAYSVQSTSIPTVPPIPSQATLISPADAATNISISPSLSWGCVLGATTYALQFSSDENFNIILVDEPELSATSYFVDGLSYNTSYFWRIQAIGSTGASDWSARSFTTTGSTTAPTLSWAVEMVNDVRRPKLSWTLPAGLTSPYKVYRYYCVYGEPDCLTPGTLITTITTPATTTYTDLAVVVAGKYDCCASTAYYYVKATKTNNQLSPSSNKAIVNDANVSWEQKHQQAEEEVIPQSAPTVTQLSSNYPNPANPSTKFNYQLSQPGRVTLIIYNTLGQEITRLVDQSVAAGYYITTWDASSASSGIYFARISISDATGTEAYRTTRKVLILK